MMVTEAKYAEDGSVRAVIDSSEVTVPDDQGNRHRRMIAEWVEAGNVIAAWVAPSAPPVTAVSARQFKLQLLAAGLLEQVEAWVASKDQAVQIAYANSGTFVRAEPMMQAGMTSLGFTSEQIDAFFAAAATL